MYHNDRQSSQAEFHQHLGCWRIRCDATWGGRPEWRQQYEHHQLLIPSEISGGCLCCQRSARWAAHLLLLLRFQLQSYKKSFLSCFPAVWFLLSLPFVFGIPVYPPQEGLGLKALGKACHKAPTSNALRLPTFQPTLQPVLSFQHHLWIHKIKLSLSDAVSQRSEDCSLTEVVGVTITLRSDLMVVRTGAWNDQPTSRSLSRVGWWYSMSMGNLRYLKMVATLVLKQVQFLSPRPITSSNLTNKGSWFITLSSGHSPTICSLLKQLPGLAILRLITEGNFKELRSS